MVVLGLATSHHDPKLQVRLHSNLDGSSLAHAIQVPMGPLRNLEVLHLFRWFSHTHTRQELDHCSDPSGTESQNV